VRSSPPRARCGTPRVWQIARRCLCVQVYSEQEIYNRNQAAAEQNLHYRNSEPLATLDRVPVSITLANARFVKALAAHTRVD
jgi:hypothetical protein